MSASNEKCPCAMSAAELLAANVAPRGDYLKAVLIEDRGRKWHVTEYSAASAGLGTDHITIQSALECIEKLMVKGRRDDTPPTTIGEIVTDPDDVAKLMAGR